jgi:exonuclease SbcC
MLRFDGCAIWGFGPFHKKVEIDFTAIAGLLIALVGPNGAGKTTFLECMTGGALYRKTETRGSLMDLATERGAYVETRCANGESYTIKQTVDPVSRKGTSSVLDVAAHPQLDSASVEEFDEWSREHLPPARVLYSSLFAVQGKAGFLDLKEGDQKAVLLRVIGVEELEKKAARARAKLKGKKNELATLMARIADEKERGLDVAVADKELAERQATVATCRAALEKVREDLARAEVRAAEIERLWAEKDAQTAALAGAKNTLAELEEKLRDLVTRRNNNRMVLDLKTEIEFAVARDPVLLAEEARLKELRDAALRLREVSAREAERLRREEREAFALFERRAKSVTLLAPKLKGAAAIEAAQGKLEKMREALADAELDQNLKWERLQELRGQCLLVAEKRIDILRPAIDEIADGAEDPGDLACDAVAADDDTEALAEKAAAEIEPAEAAYEKASGVVEKQKAELLEVEQLAARAESLAETRARLAEAAQEEAEARAKVELLDKAFLEAAEARDAADTTYAKHDAALKPVLDEWLALGPYLKRKDQLVAAEARIAELDPQIADAVERVAVARRAYEALLPPEEADVLPLPVDLVGERRRLERAEAELSHATSMIAVAEARKASAHERAHKLASFAEKREVLEGEIADWALLAESLGRDGLQALEIDVAGPELTAMINELLQTCLGTRWSVWVATTRDTGKKQIEELSLRVCDSQSGREGTAGSLSGGEKVLVGEAISLALTMLSCRRSGVLHPTLIRDESGAALDAANAPIYIAMLRHAARLVEASHVIFVSHSPAVQALADERIEFGEGGDVRVAA